MNDLTWRKHAECLDAPSDWFFAQSENGTITAGMRKGLALCEQCPVRTDCLEWAVDTNQEMGVLGGMTPHARRRLRRQRLGVSERGRWPREFTTDVDVLFVLQTSDGVTLDELASRCGVSVRTVQRSLRSLAAEWPVYARDAFRGRVFLLGSGGQLPDGVERVSA